MNEQPRILIFTGEGKGKTTAALGMALRAVGHGMRVLVMEFVKQDSNTGELAAAKSVANLEIVQTGRGFIPKPESSKFSEHQQAAQAGLLQAGEAIASGNYDLIILDEICIAVSCNLIPEDDVLEMLDRLPNGLRLVMTGRHATPGLIERADTVSEIRCVKHAMDDGRPAQKGVEL